MNQKHFLSLQGELQSTLPQIESVLNNLIFNTQVAGSIKILPSQTAMALESLSKHSINPKWLIYLPPTMSPAGTSNQEGYLERPEEAFEYFKLKGYVDPLILEQKHMGSRGVVIVCKDQQSAIDRFDIKDEQGTIYSRTGKRFFEDKNWEKEIINRFQQALTKANFWSNFKTNWVIFDCEIMPWSFKSVGLMQRNYAACFSAGKEDVASSYLSLMYTHLSALNSSPQIEKEFKDEVSPNLKTLRDIYFEKHRTLEKFKKSYQRYCWAVKSIDDIKIAPFHILATEGKVHDRQSHVWHMNQIGNIWSMDSSKTIFKTWWKQCSLNDKNSIKEAINWWEENTNNGEEGMVVKPYNFLSEYVDQLHGPSYLQPAVKVRGKEYLRIIYGHDYDSPKNLEKLRRRGLKRKRMLALQEFALGLESLHRFVNYDNFNSYHSCVAGILALESEPMDPRL